jgi:hypothetical protein
MLRIPKRNTELSVDFSPRRRLTGGNFRLDFSSQQQALTSVSQAIGQRPQYREVDVSSGIESVARATAGAGKEFAQLAQRNQEITDRRKLFAGETTLRVAQETIAAELQGEKDPAKWAQIFDERFPAVMQSLDMEGMSAEATELMKAHADRVYKLGRIKTVTDSVRQNESLYIRDLEASRDLAKQNGDPGRFGYLTGEIAKAKGLTPNETKRDLVMGGQEIAQIQQAKLAERVSTLVAGKQFHKAFAEIDQDPWLNLEGNEDLKLGEVVKITKAMRKNDASINIAMNPQKVIGDIDAGAYQDDPVLASEIRKMAENEVINRSAMATRKLNDTVAKYGASAALQMLKSNTPQFRDLTPAQKAEAIEDLGKPVPSNSPAQWSQFMTEITNFQGGQGEINDEGALTMVEQAAQMKFSGPMLDSVNRAISDARARLKGTEEKNPIPGEITKLFKDGVYGAFEGAYSTLIKTPERLSPQDIQLGEQEVIKDEAKVVDQVALAKAVQVQQELLRYEEELRKAGVPEYERRMKLDERMAPIRASMGLPKSPVKFTDFSSGPNPMMPPVNPDGTPVRTRAEEDGEELRKIMDTINKLPPLKPLE